MCRPSGARYRKPFTPALTRPDPCKSARVGDPRVRAGLTSRRASGAEIVVPASTYPRQDAFDR